MFNKINFSGETGLSNLKQITRAGYEYQDLIGIRELLQFYKNKNLYDFIRLEYPNNDKFRALDDVVCKIKNQDKYKLIQVKFSVDGETPLCNWNWLTNKKGNGNSLVQKWSKTTLELLSDNKLLEASLVTNKQPTDEIQQVLNNNKIVWNNIPDAQKAILIEQIGSEENCKIFFENWTLEFLQSDLKILDNNLFNEYIGISDSRANWEFFKSYVKENSMYEGQEITYQILTNILQCRSPKPLDQEFFVPENYIPPSEEFHQKILKRIKNSDDKCIVITGSPGVGKSTYISYLKKELEKENIFVIRHHYYLSIETKQDKRYNYTDIKNSLFEQLNNIFALTLSDRDELEGVLNSISKELNDKQLIIIIDGLDHVWREHNKKDDLDILFNNLFPLPENIKVVVSTQPVDAEHLPYKLSKIERDKWLTLPFMSINAIRNYLINDKRIIEPADYHSDYYTNLAESFFKLTNGHPLHLIYSLEAALNDNLRLLPYDIERLPACPQNDIREYYRNLLNEIDEYSKLVLCIYVVSEIDVWKKSDLEECLTCNGVSDFLRHYNQIRHLLFNNGYFIKVFHESILAYIKENISDEEQIKCLKYIQKWLTEQNESIYIDLYLPIINAQLGEYSLILNISRTQIIEYFKKGYSLNLISKFLTKAEQITFFQLKDLVKTTELRHLKTRIINLLEYNTYKAELFCRLHFILYKNLDVIYYMLDSIKTLNTAELVALSAFCQNQDSKIKEILRQMKLQYKKVAGSRELENNNALYVLANSSNIEQVQQTCIDANYNDGLIYLFNHLCSLKRTDLVKNFISKGIYDYTIIRRLCLYAIEQKIDLNTWGLPKEYIENPYLAVLIYLNTGYTKANVKSLENATIHKRKNVDYEYSGRCLDLENYFHSLFFENLYNKLTGSKFNNSIETYNGFEKFVTTLFNASESIAKMVNKTKEINLTYLLSLFEDFTNADILNEVRWNLKYKIAKSSITKIIIDLLILLNIDSQKLDEKEINILIKFKHFHEDNWLEDYFQNNIVYLTPKAAKFYLKKEQDILNSTMQYTQERTDKYLQLANFAQIHNLIDDAKIYLDKAFCMAMGYCHHKDPLLYEVLETVEYCLDTQHLEFANILKRLAKIVDNIENITDSDTSYSKRVLMRLFCKYSYEYVSKYYNHFLDTEQWYNAEECLNEILENADKSDEMVNFLLSTVTSDAPFFKLAQDDIRIQEHKKLVGRTLLKEKHKYSSSNDFINKETNIFNYEDYPVNRLDEFIEKLDYTNETCLLDWLKHWRGRGQDEMILNYFEEFYKNNNKNFIRELYLDEIFDIALSVKGKDYAYKWIVRSIIENISWGNNYSSWENTKKRFLQVKKIYKDKWQDFILDSSEYKYGSEFMLGTSHLVYFLILIGEKGLAYKIMCKVIDLLEEDMADLPLKEVDWL